MTNSQFLVLRDDDPHRAEIEAAGYTIVGQSWGARLELASPPDLSGFHRAVTRVVSSGISIAELSSDSSIILHALECANSADYPYTPATVHVDLDLDATRGLWDAGFRVFGAYDRDSLVGATVICPRGAYAETEFTSVLKSYRGRGIGAAVKSASVLACAEAGARVFATGGAAANEASLAVNRSLGYRITERWFSYERSQSQSQSPPS